MIFDIDWHRVLMNLRGYAGMTMREIANETGVPPHKLHRISNGTQYRLDIDQVLALIDCHYDHCFALHTKQLIRISHVKPS